MKLIINVDDNLLYEAQSIYDALGIDTETAIRMFLKRTVLERKLPLSTNIPVNVVADSVESENGLSKQCENPISEPTAEDTKQVKNTITKAMAEDVWEQFLRYLEEGGSISAYASEAHAMTGINQGSAFIYLTILDNLVKGNHNTRNMKMADLRYYVEQIRDELDAKSYLNAIQSLKASIPYWEKDVFGNFAKKVQMFVNELEEE